jgi:hypothetical protein
MGARPARHFDQEEAAMSSRIGSLGMVLVAVNALLGCGEPAAPEEVGTVRVAITAVPADVGCIRLTAVGSRTVTEPFDVTAGASSVLLLGGVPTGGVQFSGDAFAGACASVTAQAVPTWTSDPVTAQVDAGTTASVALVMHQNGNASVSIDFPSAGAPATETSLLPPPGFQTNLGLTAVRGVAYTFTARVVLAAAGSGTPTGTVTFTDENDATLAAVPLAGGSASFTITYSDLGTHVVRARYGGDAVFQGSAAPQLVFAVVDPTTGGMCPLPSGAVAWWHGDGDFLDALAHHDAAGSDAVGFVPGVLHTAFSFDGSIDSFIEVADAPDLNPTTGITIDLWVNPGGNATGRLVDKITAFMADGYLLDLQGGDVRFDIGGDMLFTQQPIPSGVFTHVAGVYDGATIAIYVNGALAVTRATPVTSIPTNTQRLRIGADSNDGSLFVGAIDEPRIFGRALTGDEIRTLFQQGGGCP